MNRRNTINSRETLRPSGRCGELMGPMGKRAENLDDLTAAAMSENFNIASIHVDEHTRKGYGDKVAIYYDDTTVTYRQLLDYVNRVGNTLVDSGVRPENRVMISLPDCPQIIYNFLGAVKIGAVPFVVGPTSDPSDLEYYFNDSKAKVAVVSQQVKSQLDRVRDRLKFLRNELVVGEGSFEDAVRSASPYLEAFETSRDDVAYWVYTSGTTAKPKAAVHLHHDLVYSVLPYARRVVNAAREDVFYSTSKLSFSYGRVNSMHMPLMVGGSVLLDSERPEPQRVLNYIKKFRVTLFFSVPSFYNSIVRFWESGGERIKFTHLRLAISAGEPLPATIYRKWVEFTGVESLDGLGSSEAEYIFMSNFPGRSKPGCAGELIPGWEAKLVDENGDIVEKPGVVGVLWVRSDSIAAYYWKRHNDSQATFVGEWYNTRDMLYRDDSGCFYYVGRSDDLFKVRGMWVSPSEIEDILLSHPAVAECAVVGKADEVGLLKPKAFVVLKSGLTESKELIEDLRAHVGKKLPSYKVPFWVDLVQEIPKTITGKLQRYKFRSGGRD